MGKQVQVSHQPVAAPVPTQPLQSSKPISPSDDLLQLDAAFGAPLPQQPSASTAFSSSPAFPPSQPFPPMQQTAPVGFSPSPWGPAVSSPSSGNFD